MCIISSRPGEEEEEPGGEAGEGLQQYDFILIIVMCTYCAYMRMHNAFSSEPLHIPQGRRARGRWGRQRQRRERRERRKRSEEGEGYVYYPLRVCDALFMYLILTNRVEEAGERGGGGTGRGEGGGGGGVKPL